MASPWCSPACGISGTKKQQHLPQRRKGRKEMPGKTKTKIFSVVINTPFAFFASLRQMFI
jgi:hypothetical protein